MDPSDAWVEEPGRGAVLLVDRDAAELARLAEALSHAGYATITAMSLADAVAMASDAAIDAMVLDASLSDPGALAAFNRFPAVPVVLASDQEIVNAAFDLFSASESFYLVGSLMRPVSGEALIRELARAFEPPTEDGEWVEPAPLESDDDGGFAHEATEADASFPRAIDPLELGARMAARIQSQLGEVYARSGELARQLTMACARFVEEGGAPDRLFDESQGRIALTGFIDAVPMDQILQVATSVRPPARCRLEHADQCVDVYFVGTDVVYARQDNLPEGFAIGRFLVDSGKVSEAILEASLRAQRTHGGRLGEILTRLGAIVEADLYEALERQTSELVYEAVRWSTGKFTIWAEDTLPWEARQAGYRLPVQHLLLEGMRRLDDWHRLISTLGHNVILDRIDQFEARIASLPAPQRLLLRFIDGRRTVDELIRASRRPSYDVVRQLSELLEGRLVTVAGTLSQLPFPVRR